MITARNEFETVPAFEHIAGSNNGSWTMRETAFSLISTLETISSYDTSRLYKDLAECNDDDGYLDDMQLEVMELLNEYMPMPEFCSVSLNDGEYTVTPYIDEYDDTPRLSDYPDTLYKDESGMVHYTIFIVNDHGNVTCQTWNDQKREYITQWDIV